MKINQLNTHTFWIQIALSCCTVTPKMAYPSDGETSGGSPESFKYKLRV